MGALGRDLAFWLFLGSSFVSLFWNSLIPIIVSIVFTMLFFYHFLAERPRAIRESKVKGLQIVTLVPLSLLIARLHLLLFGRKIAGKWSRAYEIHVPEYFGPDYVKLLNHDLSLIEKTFPRPALYFWETPAPVPASIRRFIREKEKEGKAYWIKGSAPVPNASSLGFSRARKKHVRRGVMMID